MPVGINPIQQQANPLERIANILQIYQGVQGIGKNSDERDANKIKSDAIKRRMDASSPESAQERAAAAELGFKVSPTDTVDSIEMRYGKTPEYYQKRFSEAEHRKTELAKLGKTQQAVDDPSARLASAPVELKSKVGLIANALGNMTDVEKAYAKGDSPSRINADTPILGTFVSDTDLTRAQRNIDEAMGRLQSGGAIGKEELKTFRAMGPRPGDSDEEKVKKIKSQRQFLEDRLTAFGFTPQDLGKVKGFDLAKLGYGKEDEDRRQNLFAAHKNPGEFSLIPGTTAMAAEPKAKPTQQDQQAIQWAKANSKDPRAAAILKANGL